MEIFVNSPSLSSNQSNTMGAVTENSSTAFIFTAMVFYATIFGAGLIGNALSVFAIVGIPSMRTDTNYLLLNNAVADILILLLVVPTGAIELITPYWLFRRTGCFVQSFLETVVSKVGAISMFFIALERWLVIARPLKAKRWLSTYGFVRPLALTINWAFAVFCSLPVIWETSYKRTPNGAICRVEASDTLSMIHATLTVVIFCLGFVTSVLCIYGSLIRTLFENSQGRAMVANDESSSTMEKRANDRRIIKTRRSVIHMMSAMAIAHVICLVPFRALGLTILYQMVDYSRGETLFVAFHVCRILYYSNSLVNPVIYALMSGKFRSAFAKVVKCRCRLREDPRAAYAQSEVGRSTLHQRSPQPRHHDGVELLAPA